MSTDLRNEIISWIKTIVLSILIALIIKTFIFRPVFAKSISMEPTIHEGEIFLLWKLDYKLGDPKRGDIVVMKKEEDTLENLSLLKRVIGLSGETIEIKDDSVYIEDKELEPDYTLDSTPSNGFEKSVVPDNEYFMMGDNRARSRDSRDKSVGFIDRKNIEGKLIFRLWPINKIGPLN